MSEGTLYLVAGVVVGVVVARRLVALAPVSELLFGGFDQRENDDIANDPASYGGSMPGDDDGGWQ